MLKKDLIYKLKSCFKKCATGRTQLRNCVIDIMDAGLTKKDVLDVSHEMFSSELKDEVYLCAVTAIGQAISYELDQIDKVNSNIDEEIKIIIKDKLKKCFTNCGNARKKLRSCVKDLLKAGISKEEILGITDDLVGGFGRDEVSVCAIVAVEQVLNHNEAKKLKNIIKIYAPYMNFSDDKLDINVK